MSDTTDPSSAKFSFVEAELAVLDFWAKHDTFRKSLEQTAEAPPYIFYDGPPFATGLPHHGHLLASTLKDVVPRYWTMKGRHVQRRFGWDCHGLPIEHEIDKSLGISSAEAVAKLGIKGYNDECRAIVQRYTAQWRKTINRIGRWVDFDHDYKTMDPWYMESVWWVVKQLWDKGLIYRGEKVVPFSTALGTVLSNFEAGSNYQDVQDPSVTVLFKLQGSDRWLAAWTTTPWTLPSNLALCVREDITYLEAYDAELGRTIILAEARLDEIAKHKSLEVRGQLKGSDLVGLSYEPLFDYFKEMRSQGAFVVLADDYVSTESGTGIVHQAPAFGEDDFRVLRSAGISATACPVDMAGKFTQEVSDYAGQHVKEADKQIIKHLKASGQLYIHEVINHSYPFCPRSDTPIIYRTIDSWYVKVEQLRDKLLAANAAIRWVPEHIKHGRMGNWLEGAVDWAISRNRYWGTPLPIWINDETGAMLCVGAREELAALTGTRLDDLHRETVDPLTFSLEGEPGTYRRVEEVLDCWFESGSMPYAQLHYPFENEALFQQGFPAEFVSEGLDQTRGWFYTLIVLGTALFDAPPFKNVIVSGIVMAGDGKKMSKRLRNYTPPDELMEAQGADALRLYLINSGLVKGEEQRFTDEDVKDMVRRALLPWLNAFRFLHTYASIDGWRPSGQPAAPTNIMDQWLLSRLESLKASIATEMEAYRLYNVVPALFTFIEDLTNWYIRLNRSRFWRSGMDEDKAQAYQTLYETLHELCLTMAPFAPFLAESIYRSLATFSTESLPDSVHLCPYPEAKEERIKPLLEQAVTRMQHIILLGRQKRNQARVKTRYPLANLKVIHRDEALLKEIARLEGYLLAELNVKQVSYERNEQDYILLYAKPNSPVLGKRLGKRFKDYKAAIEALGSDTIDRFQAQGSLSLAGETFAPDDILVFREAKEGTNALSNRFISIDLDCKLTETLISEGLAREVVNRIQKSRKEAGFNVTDRIKLTAQASERLAQAISAHEQYIKREALITNLALEVAAGDKLGKAGEGPSHGFKFEVDDELLAINISIA